MCNKQSKIEELTKGTLLCDYQGEKQCEQTWK